MLDDFMMLVKYAIEGLAVSVAAFYIPQREMDLVEIVMLAITAATTLLVLDLFAPAVGSSARMGAGFGIGAKQVGFGGGAGVVEGMSGGCCGKEHFDY